MQIRRKTLDDLLRAVFDRLLRSTKRTGPSKGENTEIRGVLLELKSPRARLSRTETKGKPFSGLGEFLWYFSASNRLDFIEYYLPKYRDLTDDGSTLYGAYGPRLVNQRGVNQLANLLRVLKTRPDSRRAVIQLFNAEDLVEEHKDIPCTTTLQFMLRDGRLHMMASMRSNDVFRGLPHDIFAFTMLQEFIARQVSASPGRYLHAVGSLHLYDSDRERAKQFLDEGWHEAKKMPRMPADRPGESLRELLKAEEAIRTGKDFDIEAMHVATYWKDIARLLQVFGCYKRRSSREKLGSQLDSLKSAMSTRVYDAFIDSKLLEAEARGTGGDPS